MQLKTLLNPKGIKERVLPKDILAKLQAGYKVPNKTAYLYNSAGNLKKILLENNSLGQKTVIELLKQGYSFDPSIVKTQSVPITKQSVPVTKPIQNIGDFFNKLDAQFAEYNKQITAPLNARIEELEKKLKEKEEEFEVFRKLSQINIKKQQELQPAIFNAVTKQLLDIIANNPLEEIVLNHKEEKYSFSGVVKIKK
jgi:molecular chaperone GrpE (heat shock protein)